MDILDQVRDLVDAPPAVLQDTEELADAPLSPLSYRDLLLEEQALVDHYIDYVQKNPWTRRHFPDTPLPAVLERDIGAIIESPAYIGFRLAITDATPEVIEETLKTGFKQERDRDFVAWANVVSLFYSVLQDNPEKRVNAEQDITKVICSIKETGAEDFS